jgi:hypothetical protein
MIINHTNDGYTQLTWQGGINNYFNQTVVMMAAQLNKE